MDLQQPARIAAGATFGAIAGLRRGKAVHPHGVVHRATLTIPGRTDAPQGSELFRTPATHRALVRFSRSIGLPEPLPDLFGLALRVIDVYGPDQHQDLLMVTSVDLPVLHHVFFPVRGTQQLPYSSSLPYRAGDETFLVGAVPEEKDFRLSVAPMGGRFRPVGKLTIDERLDDTLDALRFNPIEHTGGGLEPSGFLNDLRQTAYRSSQAAWGTTREHGAARQRQAERLLRRTFARR